MIAKYRYKTQDNYQKTFKVCCGVFVLAVLFRIGVSGKVNLANPELSAKYEQKLMLEKQIADLKYTDLELSSIAKVSLKAKELGFLTYTQGLSALKVEVGAPIAANTVR